MKNKQKIIIIKLSIHLLIGVIKIEQKFFKKRRRKNKIFLFVTVGLISKKQVISTALLLFQFTLLFDYQFFIAFKMIYKNKTYIIIKFKFVEVMKMLQKIIKKIYCFKFNSKKLGDFSYN